MFCPKCSQQQISAETRFCSRCGLELGVVKALLAIDDMPGTLAAGTQPNARSLRKRDLSIGALLMFICALPMAAITVDLPPSHSARIVLLIIAWLSLTLLINIVPVLRYFFKGDTSAPLRSASVSKIEHDLITQANPPSHNPALPPAQKAPAINFGRQPIQTAEVARPPSVTEQTTNLLTEK